MHETILNICILSLTEDEVQNPLYVWRVLILIVNYTLI